jgi:hypothetical protein
MERKAEQVISFFVAGHSGSRVQQFGAPNKTYREKIGECFSQYV